MNCLHPTYSTSHHYYYQLDLGLMAMLQLKEAVEQASDYKLKKKTWHKQI